MSKGKGSVEGKGATKAGEGPLKDARPSLADRMVSGLASVVEALESGEPIEKRLTVRTVKLDFTPKAYTPEDVKAVREKTGASQAVFAKFLGVSVQALRHWEQGTRRVPMMASRFLDEIDADPGIWTRRLQSAAK